MVKCKIKVGIAGYGYSAKTFHIPFLKGNSHYEIRKIFSRKINLRTIDGLDCQVVYEFDELLSDDIDVVIICTPNTEHFWMAERAIKSGKHVIIEKPLAVTASEALKLEDRAQENKVFVSAYQNRRLDGGFLTAKKVIEDGMLGEILDYESHFDRYVTGRNKKEWKNMKTEGVNILYDLGVHLIDQVYSLFGMPEEVYADFRKQREETPDFDNFEIKLYYEKLKATVSAGEVVAEPGPHIVVRGKKGSYTKFGMDVQEQALKNGETPVNSNWGEDVPENYGSLCVWENGTFNKKRIKTESGDYGRYYDNFYDALNGECELIVKIQQSIDVLKIIEAANKSNIEKKRISLV